MKLADFDTPVHSSWLAEQGFRLDPAPYVSDSYQARKLLERIPGTVPLSSVTERIFHPGIYKRQWTTDREHGVPFLGSAAIFQSDLSSLPLIAKSSFEKKGNLGLESGWTLVTRSGMTAGRVTYTRPQMVGYACSEDVLRIVAERNLIHSGYLYAFLSGPYGRSMIRACVYGSSIKHIEPAHLMGLPVPRVDPSVEKEIGSLLEEAMQMRFIFQDGIRSATDDLLRSSGLSRLIDFDWHAQGRDIGFSVPGIAATSLRALNYSPRASWLMEMVRSNSYAELGEICSGGYLGSGVRFKRHDLEPDHGGARLIGQRHGFWMRPEGRWIDPRKAPSGIFASDETVLISAQGSLGDFDTLGKSIFVNGSWLEYAYTQHFLRVVSGDRSIPGAYLFAFLRSEPAVRMLRSMAVGSIQQDIHPELRRHLPVPMCPPEDRERIAETVRQAYRWRDEADMKEDMAQALLDKALREAAG